MKYSMVPKVSKGMEKPLSEVMILSGRLEVGSSCTWTQKCRNWLGYNNDDSIVSPIQSASLNTDINISLFVDDCQAVATFAIGTF